MHPPLIQPWLDKVEVSCFLPNFAFKADNSKKKKVTGIFLSIHYSLNYSTSHYSYHKIQQNCPSYSNNPIIAIQIFILIVPAN